MKSITLLRPIILAKLSCHHALNLHTLAVYIYLAPLGYIGSMQASMLWPWLHAHVGLPWPWQRAHGHALALAACTWGCHGHASMPKGGSLCMLGCPKEVILACPCARCIASSPSSWPNCVPTIRS